MSCRLSLALVLAGCSFEPSTASNTGDDTGDPPRDAALDDASATPGIDAAPAPDAPPGSQVTTFTSVADLYLRTSVAPDENTNDRDFMVVDGDLVTVILLRFDLTALPAGTSVLGAELRLVNANDSGEPCTFHRLLEAWDEATATANQRMTGVSWGGVGATPPSRANEVAGTISPILANLQYSADLDPALVASWVQTPATNFGVALITASSNGSKFWTREVLVSAARPVLRVTHSP